MVSHAFARKFNLSESVEFLLNERL